MPELTSERTILIETLGNGVERKLNGLDCRHKGCCDMGGRVGTWEWGWLSPKLAQIHRSGGHGALPLKN